MATRKQRDEEEKPKTKEPVVEEEKQQASADDAVVEIEVGDPEAEKEDEDEDESTEIVDERPSRQQKKRARRNEFEEARSRAAALEAENARMKQEWAQYQQSLQAQQAQQYTQQQVSQAEQRLHDDMKTFYGALEGAKRADGSLPPEQVADFERRAKELEERKFQVYAAKHGLGQQQYNPQQIAAYVEGEQIKAKYADILANQAAKTWGEGRLYQIAAERGLTAQNITKAQYYELLEQAADDTRRQFRMNGHANPLATRRPAPDAATKARFSGVSARASGGAGAGETVRVTIGKAQRQLARGAFPDDPEDVAIRKWAQGPGRRAALAAQNRR